jgi:GNAT superfamily N-acetyltransferase
MRFHFDCSRHGLADGRAYFLWWQSGQVVGLVGLHHTIWGPDENVWLAWFAVEPSRQGRGLGRILLASVENLARDRGHRKLFVETYQHADFARARRFYEANGFQKVGRVNNYLADGSPMIVYAKQLCEIRSTEP